jgi:hypothetical protein
MSPNEEELTEFERKARAVLEEGVSSIDARVRSRLNRARHMALADIAESPRSSWRNRAFVPTGVAAAAVVAVALVVWNQQPHSRLNGATQSSAEDLELLADDEAFELIEDDGAFYEWAATENDVGGASG